MQTTMKRLNLIAANWFGLIVCGIVAGLLSVWAFENVPEIIHVKHPDVNWRVNIFSSRPETTSKDLSIVAISDQDLKALPYVEPIDRAYLSELLTRIAKYKPRAIVLDIIFDRDTEPSKDLLFVETIKAISVPVILASRLDDEVDGVQAEENCQSPANLGAQCFLKLSGRKSGYADLDESAEHDANSFTVTHIPAAVDGRCSLSALIANPDCHKPSNIPTAIDWQLLPSDGKVNFNVFSPHDLSDPGPSLSDILEKDDCRQHRWTGPTKLSDVTPVALRANLIHCRTIVVGGILSGDKDRFSTPIRRVNGIDEVKERGIPGVLIHAAAAQQLIDGRILREFTKQEVIEAALFLGVIGALLRRKTLTEWGVVSVSVALVLQIADTVAYKGFQVLIPGDVMALSYAAGSLFAHWFSWLRVNRRSKILHSTTGKDYADS